MMEILCYLQKPINLHPVFRDHDISMIDMAFFGCFLVEFRE